MNVFIVLPMSSLLPDPRNQAAQLAQVAEDSDIQAELAAINAEFAITQMYGLGI